MAEGQDEKVCYGDRSNFSIWSTMWGEGGRHSRMQAEHMEYAEYASIFLSV